MCNVLIINKRYFNNRLETENNSCELFYPKMDFKYRKTEPIYNAIDRRQWTRALKLCNDKKIEKWDIVKVLKGKLEKLTTQAVSVLQTFNYHWS